MAAGPFGRGPAGLDPERANRQATGEGQVFASSCEVDRGRRAGGGDGPVAGGDLSGQLVDHPGYLGGDLSNGSGRLMPDDGTP